jgi:hypothetical protein
MIKQAVLIRERLVLPEAIGLCKRMALLVENYFGDEIDVINVLKRRGEEDLALDLARFLMERFGHPPSHVKEARFDKTKRALAKLNGKPPRGEPRPRRVDDFAIRETSHQQE